jgi:ribosomal protein S18 acetylase RimI-like enzyme
MKNTLILVTLFSIVSLSAMDDGQQKNACTAFEPTTHIIESFNMVDHLTEFTELFLKLKETLIRRENFDLTKMLFHDSINYDDEATHGSLKLFVLRDREKEEAKMTLRAFVGYTVSKDGKSYQGNLLAVKEEDRRKHYAHYLVRYGLEKAISAGADDMWLSTNKENKAAQAVYKQVADKYPQYELVVEPGATRFPNKPLAVQEVLVFNLKPKSQQP